MDATEMFNTYLYRLERRRVGTTALREYRIVSESFLAWLADAGLKLEEVRRRHVEDFFRDTGWSPTTQRSRVTWLRAPWKYAKEELEVLERTPFDGAGLELAPVPEREPKVISTADLRTILGNAGSHEEAALLRAFAYTGFRLMEVRGLTWEDVSFGNQTLHTIGKGNKERTIPLHPALHEALRDYGVYGRGSAYVFPGRDGQEMTHGGMSAKIARLTRGLAAPHDFRRTFTTSMYVNGAMEAATKQILGHSKKKDITLVHYVNLPQRVLMEAILRVYRDDPI